ncbi:MAG: type IV pilus twitching motility protein PilT [Acidobacteria bacterium]|nr:type IV pilus twitching motility protein PilT [Acidobacteriota bacterium]
MRKLTKTPLGEREIRLLLSEWEELSKGQKSFQLNEEVFHFEERGGKFLFTRGRPEHTQTEQFDTQKLLKLIVEKGASDLHLSSGCRPIIRLDGEIITLEEFDPVNETELLNQLKAIVPANALKQFEETNDVDLAYSIPGLARFRTNIFRDHRGACVVFRVIPSEILTLKMLGVPKEVVELTSLSKGLILVTGPTGSGKSTTLAALVDHINRTCSKHIITIEDPLEFIHENKKSHVNQREIHTHTESFKKSLRAALREDPDVILVGEMRDLETIAIAVEMAVTGHLVLGTLHTATAVGTVDRIVDQFPVDQQSQIRVMLSDSLVGVVSQVLCKKKGGGRIAAYEVLIVTPSVANLIRESKTFQIPSLMQTGRGLGMQLMNDALLELVEKKIVSAEDAVARSTDPDDLRKTLKMKGLS